MEEEEVKQLSKSLAKMAVEVLGEVLTEPLVQNWNMPLKKTLAAINLRRIAKLGGWTEEDIERTRRLFKNMAQEEQYVDARMFLLFACCLDLIPPERQKVAATLWTERCPRAVLEQIQHEMTAGPDGSLDPSSDTCWWLAARKFSSSHIQRDIVTFHHHLESFPMWMETESERLISARQTLGELRTFRVVNGVAFVDDAPRCENPYFFGYKFMVGYELDLDVFTLATYHDSLGLEDFLFSEELYENGERVSGLVDGSSQYAHISSFEELGEAVKVVRRKLG